MDIRMKAKDIKILRERLLAKDSVCPLCQEEIGDKAALDHDHSTGHIRGVLCLWCNAQGGRIENAANRAKKELTPLQWLRNLIKYLEGPNREEIHPSHGAAKRRASKKAKAKRKQAKESKSK